MHQVATKRLPAAAAAAFLMFAAALFFLLMNGSGSTATATHQPADKVTANGSTTEVISPQEEVTLLSGTLRTSSPADLLLQVSAECAITTEITTVGNDRQRAEGKVTVWVEITDENGETKTVGVNDGDTEGEVVFCNRVYERETTLFDDEDATIRTFMDTRQANAFNWVALNVGKGIQLIEVKARLEQEATLPPEGEDPRSSAMAAVGNRTLIVEPAKMANDAGV
jgi:hypothetical protein